MIITSDIDQFSIVQFICSKCAASTKETTTITTFYANSHQYIVEKIPKEIFNMINLISLGFSDIKIKIKIIPKSIINLRELQHLYINNCDIQVIDFKISNTVIKRIEIANIINKLYISGTVYYKVYDSITGYNSKMIIPLFYNKLGRLCNIETYS